MNFLKNKRLLLFVFFIAFIVALRFTGVDQYISLEQLKVHREWLKEMVAQNYTFSVLIYISLYIIGVALSLPVAAVLTLSAGFLFGVLFGTIYANIGATIGCTISFLMTRYFFGDSVQKQYADKLIYFNKEMEKYGTSYLIFAHLIVVIPLPVLNFLIALTKIPLHTFVWTTSAGIFPVAVVYTFAGRQLATFESMKDILTTPVIGAFLLLALLALLPILVKKYMNK